MKTFVVGILVVLLSSVAQADTSGPSKCMRWVDIVDLTRAGPDEVIAKAKAGSVYRIKFTAACDYQRFADYYFEVEPQQRLACVTRQDVFRVHNAAACLIERITPVPADQHH